MRAPYIFLTHTRRQQRRQAESGITRKTARSQRKRRHRQYALLPASTVHTCYWLLYRGWLRAGIFAFGLNSSGEVHRTTTSAAARCCAYRQLSCCCAPQKESGCALLQPASGTTSTSLRRREPTLRRAGCAGSAALAAAKFAAATLTLWTLLQENGGEQTLPAQCNQANDRYACGARTAMPLPPRGSRARK